MKKDKIDITIDNKTHKDITNSTVNTDSGNVTIPNSTPMARKCEKETESKKYKDSFIKLNEKSRNNLFCIQNTETKISEIADADVKELLTALYETSGDAKETALATICKGILIQGKAFFSLSRGSLDKAIKRDPDNKFKPETKLSRLTAHLAHYKIIQLWDAKTSGARKAAGFVVEHEDILLLLKLKNEDLMVQFQELKAFCENDDLSESLVFDSLSGDIRIQKAEIRKLILDKRKQAKDKGVKELEKSVEINEQRNETKDIQVTRKPNPFGKFGSRNDNILQLNQIQSREKIKSNVISFVNNHHENLADASKKEALSELEEYIQKHLPENLSKLPFMNKVDLNSTHDELLNTLSDYKQFERYELVLILDLILGTNTSGHL